MTVLLAVLALAGCGAAEDAVRGAADAAGEEARDAVGQVATDAVRSQVCQVAKDGQVSEAELAVLRTAVAGAEGAGLPEDLTAAVREVVGSAGEPSEQAVQRLEDACSGAPSQ
jgi:hypothetical protein